MKTRSKVGSVILVFLLMCFSSITLIASSDSIAVTIKVLEKQSEEPIIGIPLSLQKSEVGTVSDKSGIAKLNIAKDLLPDTLTIYGALKDMWYMGYKIGNNVYITSNKTEYIFYLNEVQSDEIYIEEDKTSRVLNSKTVTQTEEITRRGLTKAACCNLSESFETNPAVDANFQDAVTGAKRIMLLGLDGKYSQIMTEKTPNTRGLAIPYGMNFIPGTWMQSIQISKGTSTVATGYESVTGQINVEYKKPENLEPLFINAYVNQFGRSEVNLDYSAQMGDSWSSMYFLHGSVSPFQIDNNSDGFLDLPMKRDLSGMARFKFNTDELEGQFGFKAINNKTLGGQSSFHNNSSFGLNNQLGYNPNLENYGVGIGIERYEGWFKSGAIFDAETDFSLALIANAYSHDQNGFIGNNLYRGREDLVNTNLLFETAEFVGGHKLASGLSFMYNYTSEEYSSIEYFRNELVPGAFVEYTFTGIKDLIAVLGTRVDAHNLFGTYVTPRIHAKYSLSDFSTLRATAGRGWRAPTYLAETQGMLVSGRTISGSAIENQLVEDAWNYGGSYTWIGEVWGIDADLNLDFYHTDFARQFVTDRDENPEQIIYKNIDDAGYSNSLQAVVGFEPLKRTDVVLGYRYNDVQSEMGGELRQMPLLSPHSGFLNIEYRTILDIWTYDLTVVYNGPGRLPNNPEINGIIRDETYPGWVRLNAQVTYDWDGLEIYLGGENLLNYRQPNPIISADYPFAVTFDASQIWAPILGATVYTGFRYSFY
ncbi:MAG: TonB-dependent receptor [Candidatus Kapaibacteriales bacterium]